MEVFNLKNRLLERVSHLRTKAQEVTSDVLLLDFTIVNAFLIGDPFTDRKDYILVDTGLENSYDFIIHSAERRFGKGTKPNAIVLTHGHFDHVGSVIKLAEEWDVPVYVHPLELPYLTGEKDYPLANPEVGGGKVAEMSQSFPHTSIDISNRVYPLPEDGSIPDMPAWKWIHTPGHTKGHISLYREMDRVLIAGDALSTTKQESLLAILTQKEQMSGPPAYMTEDWNAAKESLLKLKALDPHIIAPSHGKPIRGRDARESLDNLIRNFDKLIRENLDTMER